MGSTSRRRAARRTSLALLALIAAGAAGPAAAAGFRLEVGAGVVHTDYDLSFDVELGPVDLSGDSDGALGGAGFIGSIGLWADGWGFENLSLGLEYLYSKVDSDAELRAELLGQTARLDLDLGLETQTVFLNAAWRRNAGEVHPYLGLGLGASWLDGRLEFDASTDVAGGQGVRVVDFDQEGFAPSGQLFAGLDHDLGERFYVGFVARYFLIDGRLFGQDQVIRDLSAQAKLGIRF